LFALLRRLKDGEQGAEHYAADFLRLDFSRTRGKGREGGCGFPQSENNRIVL
jgi:hypothetical protein